MAKKATEGVKEREGEKLNRKTGEKEKEKERNVRDKDAKDKRGGQRRYMMNIERWRICGRK